MTFSAPRRAIALILMITLIGSTFAGAFPRAAYADEDTPTSAPAADSVAPTDASSQDSDTSTTPVTTAADSSDAATTDSSAAQTDQAAAVTTNASSTATAVDDAASEASSSASSSSSDMQTMATTTGGSDPVPDTSTVTDTASSEADALNATDTSSVPGSVSSATPSAPSGDTIATTSTNVAATTTSAIATTTPFQIPLADAASTTASTTPTILSGEAVAVANILNIVNTNIVNSQGAVVLGNYFDPVAGTIDLRSSNPFGALACDLISCDTGGISVHVGNDASIDNAVVLSADSGSNAISATGNAAIQTGNAYAGLNLVNLANTNIVDSNYLLVTLNAFQGISGDIVFPSLSNFLNQLSGGSSGSFSVDPTADVHNIISANADSGGNSAVAASSTIATGSANSSGNVFNRINTASLGGGNVSILFRVQGNWTGQVFGAPTGLNWTQGSDGSIMLFGNPMNEGTSMANADITGSSTAHISNDVSVAALTGDNHVNVDGSALISTGNALAGANVVNVANTNVVGRNWILAVVNIFGDFTGNIAFGRPDLWAGEQVQVPSFIQNGSAVTYKYTVINNGDSPASDAVLTDSQDMDHLDISDPSVPYTTDSSGHLVWQLGTIPAGQAMEVTYTATVKGTQPGAQIANSITVGEHETDNNMTDNTDTATITTSSAPSYSSAPYANETDKQVTDLIAAAAPDLSAISLIRGTATTTIDHSGKAHETITVRNKGTAASPSLALHDILRDPSGTMVQDQSGDIGVLQPGDAVTIGYDLSFASDAPSGTYSFSSVVSAGDMSALSENNGALVLKGTPTATSGISGKTKRIVSTIAGSFTTQIAHASDGNLAASAASAGISWQLWLFLLLGTGLAVGIGTQAMRLRAKKRI